MLGWDLDASIVTHNEHVLLGLWGVRRTNEDHLMTTGCNYFVTSTVDAPLQGRWLVLYSAARIASY